MIPLKNKKPVGKINDQLFILNNTALWEELNSWRMKANKRRGLLLNINEDWMQTNPIIAEGQHDHKLPRVQSRDKNPENK